MQTMKKDERHSLCAAISRLEGVIARLIGPDGCPWDREQTPHSLGDYLAEEMFELIDAIRRDDVANVREEMGDVVFLLLFVARLFARKAGDENFFAQALEENADKMIRRHPHVFAEEHFAGREELLQAWERIKRQEKAEKDRSGEAKKVERLFASLPSGLPPLLKAYRLHSKAARAGFTWDEDDDAAQQFEAEWLEWLDAGNFGSPEEKEKEFGDMLFTLVELGRRKGLKANAALELTNIKFLRRFARMEELAEAQGRSFAELDMAEKEALWEQAKAEERTKGA